MEEQKTSKSQNCVEEKKKIEELSLADFQTYYKVWKILVLPYDYPID